MISLFLKINGSQTFTKRKLERNTCLFCIHAYILCIYKYWIYVLNVYNIYVFLEGILKKERHFPGSRWEKDISVSSAQTA